MITVSDLHSAQSRLHGVAVRTRLIELPQALWEQPPGAVRPGETRLFLKPENQQPIGAFKLRGAYNKIASLSEAERKRAVISYSSGNHAQGVAYAARALKVKSVIVMPNNAPINKRQTGSRNCSRRSWLRRAQDQSRRTGSPARIHRCSALQR
jgi:threonine dehydratase